jgi:hypothetical protein
VSRHFWPIAESSQADYEALREAVLLGEQMQSLTAARFGRRGLAGLVAWPRTEPTYTATVVAAEHAPWTPYTDARLDALADGYDLLLQISSEIIATHGVRRCG